MSTWEQAESIAYYTTDLPPNDVGVVRRDKIPTEVEIAMLTGAPYNPEQPKEIAFRHTIFDPTRHLPKDDVRRTFQQLQVFPLAMLKNQTTRPNELAMFRREGEGPLVVVYDCVWVVLLVGVWVYGCVCVGRGEWGVWSAVGCW